MAAFSSVDLLFLSLYLALLRQHLTLFSEFQLQVFIKKTTNKQTQTIALFGKIALWENATEMLE